MIQLKNQMIKYLSLSKIPNFLRFMTKEESYVLEFHGVSKKIYPHLPSAIQPYLSMTDFIKIINWLESRFDFIDFDTFQSNTKKGILLTFDDGYANNYNNIFSFLNEKNIPAIFFLSTDYVNNSKKLFKHDIRKLKNFNISIENIEEEVMADIFYCMNSTQVLEISKNKLFEIGSHMQSHPNIEKCTEREIIKEMNESKLR